MSDRVIAVYLLANKRNGTLYLGVASDLARRIYEHREGIGSPFTKKYGVAKLVWYEIADWYDGARAKEKTHEDVEARLENKADRREESELG